MVSTKSLGWLVSVLIPRPRDRRFESYLWSHFYVRVYVLENAKGQLYIGHTDNLENRILSHNRTDKIAGKFTRKNGPWQLVWSEAHPTRAAAMARERQIKGMKSAHWIREALLNGGVPTGRD